MTEDNKGMQITFTEDARLNFRADILVMKAVSQRTARHSTERNFIREKCQVLHLASKQSSTDVLVDSRILVQVNITWGFI